MQVVEEEQVLQFEGQALQALEELRKYPDEQVVQVVYDVQVLQPLLQLKQEFERGDGKLPVIHASQLSKSLVHSLQLN